MKGLNQVRNIADPEVYFRKVISADEALKFVKESRDVIDKMRQIVDAEKLGIISDQDLYAKKNKLLLDKLTTNIENPETGEKKQVSITDLQKMHHDKLTTIPALIENIKI
jgi:hypothetical protein